MDFFAVAAPGVEGILLAELKALSLADLKTVDGGVEFTGGWSAVARANLLSRSASRILLRIAKFPAVSLPELARKMGKVPWSEWLSGDSVAVISATSRKSRLNHTGKIANITGEAMEAALGPPGSGGAEVGVHVRFFRDVATVSLDTSGEHLHRRGYRKLAGEAPLRENIAAACLLFAGFNGGEALLDPCCGSGTFPVEAALIATSTPPGALRSFALERFPGDAPVILCAERERALEGRRTRPESPIFASDVDERALALTMESAKAAGVAELIEVEKADLFSLTPPLPSGLLVANPPFGRRLGGKAYGGLRSLIGGGFHGWRWGVVECRRPGMGSLGFSRDGCLEFTSGGLPLRFLTGNPG